jgi:hypothetical protein
VLSLRRKRRIKAAKQHKENVIAHAAGALIANKNPARWGSRGSTGVGISVNVDASGKACHRMGGPSWGLKFNQLLRQR